MTPALTDFLLARIAEDETVARRVPRSHMPRMLADCYAKRRIVELHSSDEGNLCPKCGWAGFGEACPCETLQILATPYADHPDYREEWKP